MSRQQLMLIEYRRIIKAWPLKLANCFVAVAQTP
jgi:hypothetical protein